MFFWLSHNKSDGPFSKFWNAFFNILIQIISLALSTLNLYTILVVDKVMVWVKVCLSMKWEFLWT